MIPLEETSLAPPGLEFGGDTLLRFANLRSWLSQADATASFTKVNPRANSKCESAAMAAKSLVDVSA